MTTQQMTTQMTMTRYLYVKDEVIIEILTSMIDKNTSAIYWAYELYYSGFEEETIILICKIYYLLFAIQNPDLESYIIQKVDEWQQQGQQQGGQQGQQHRDTIVIELLQNMLDRPLDTDTFFLHRVATYLDYDDTPDTTPNTDLAAHIVANWATNKGNNNGNNNNGAIPPILHSLTPIRQLSECLRVRIRESLITSLITTETITSNNPLIPYQDIRQYATQDISPPYALLKTVCRPIDPNQYFALFEPPRYTIINAMQIYHTQWLACASKSPIWAKRIATHRGSVVKNTVLFATEAMEETFYNKYGYEPDEQTMEVQHRNIPPIVAGKQWRQLVRKGCFPANEWESELLDSL